MHRLWLAVGVVTIAGCGDNLHPAQPQRRDASIEAAPSCVVTGGKIVLRQVVYACAATGAPPAPACIDGVVTLVTAPPGDTRNFVLELHGRIRILDGDRLEPQPFLDITHENGGPVNGTGVSELGLLGLAFHPQYRRNRELFVFYTMDNPDTADTVHPYLDVLARYTASATDPSVADPTSATVLFAIPDPFPNHNGGMIEFGADGYLYISTGDGGATAQSGSDPFRNSQNPSSLLGKILRIDVDHPDQTHHYSVPADNPYGNEVYILGLRNPWRWSFDTQTGDMWIADVGLALYEEIDFLPAGQQIGVNLGWSMYEADSCFEPPCDSTGKTFPIEVRPHFDANGPTGWWAIIGGQVYRGSCYPDLAGTYFYTDCGASILMGGRRAPDGSFAGQIVPDTVEVNPASLHAGVGGELYETDIYGNIWRIEEQPPQP